MKNFPAQHSSLSGTLPGYVGVNPLVTIEFVEMGSEVGGQAPGALGKGRFVSPGVHWIENGGINAGAGGRYLDMEERVFTEEWTLQQIR